MSELEDSGVKVVSITESIAESKELPCPKRRALFADMVQEVNARWREGHSLATRRGIEAAQRRRQDCLTRFRTAAVSSAGSVRHR